VWFVASAKITKSGNQTFAAATNNARQVCCMDAGLSMAWSLPKESSYLNPPLRKAFKEMGFLNWP
jgi:hypothetical protein